MVSSHCFFTVLVLNGVVVSFCTGKHGLKMGQGYMNGILLDHFKWLKVILYNYMHDI